MNLAKFTSLIVHQFENMKLYSFIGSLLFLQNFSYDLAFADNLYETKKTTCLSSIGFKNDDDLREKLLMKAKQMAANELYGELINSNVLISNGIISKDEVISNTIGFIRIRGNPIFKNGLNFNEACVTISAYITEKDKIKINQSFSKSISPSLDRNKSFNLTPPTGFRCATGRGSISQQCRMRPCSETQKKINARKAAIIDAQSQISPGRHISQGSSDNGEISYESKTVRSTQFLENRTLTEKIEGDEVIVYHCVKISKE